MSTRINLSALNKVGLSAYCKDLGLPRYRSDQLFQWIHHKHAASFDEMTNLPKALRERLSEQADIRGVRQASVSRSRDRTVKYLFRL
ncbi:MAG: 23S rRNA (adenine(2503)-C(2))-methyltransferase RlmN, partial [Bacteroidota bacterium]